MVLHSKIFTMLDFGGTVANKTVCGLIGFIFQVGRGRIEKTDKLKQQANK